MNTANKPMIQAKIYTCVKNASKHLKRIQHTVILMHYYIDIYWYLLISIAPGELVKVAAIHIYRVSSPLQCQNLGMIIKNSNLLTNFPKYSRNLKRNLYIFSMCILLCYLTLRAWGVYNVI